MKFVEVVGGHINPDHVLCATKHEWDTEGYVTLLLANGDSVPILADNLARFPLFGIREDVWINPDHVSIVRLTLDRKQMYTDSRSGQDRRHDGDYKCVEIVMNVSSSRLSFFVEGKDQNDVTAWSESIRMGWGLARKKG